MLYVMFACLIYHMLGALLGWLTLNYILPNQIIDELEDGHDNATLLMAMVLWLLWPVVIPTILLSAFWEYVTTIKED